MKLPRPYSLQSKFIVGLLSIIGVISIVNISALHVFMQNTIDDEASLQATIILGQVDAVQDYVRNSLRPKMYEVLPQTFVLEAMSSSYISRSVMQRVGFGEQDYLYRRVAINARNADYEATKIERELIEGFRENDEEKLWRGRKTIDGVETFIMARPVRYYGNCLVCHGRPQDAPKELREQYGDLGFYHQKDSINGIDLVGVPISKFLVQTESRFISYVALYLIFTLFILLLTYLTFRLIVVTNLRTLAGHFRRNFQDKRGVELLEKVEHSDEIEEMIESMAKLSNHLLETEIQLKRYTADLEFEVDKRTGQIQREKERHRLNLQLFIDLLRALREKVNRPGLWRSALPLLAEHFRLVRAAYICTFSGNQSYVWPETATPPALPANSVSLLLKPRLHHLGSTIFIPVGSHDDTIEGLLYLERAEGEVFKAEEAELLTAVGRQLGIAAENITAINSIIRQGQNLETIFAAIPDPLLLLEHGGLVVMANKAALKLAENLFAGEGTKGLVSWVMEHRAMDGSRLSLEQSFELVADDGRSFFVRSLPLATTATQALRFVLTLSEETEKKKMQRQVVQSEKMATVGQLAAGLAHEINNPLGVILCYSELIYKSAASKQHRQDIEVVIKHTKQAQTVLGDLLSFARPKVSTDSSTVLSEIVESVTGVFKIQAGKKNVSLRSLCDGDNLLVGVSPQIAEHILVNLLLNALDAAPAKGGEIVVSCSLAEDGRVSLKISDNGKGIDEKILPHIFDPFFTTKEVSKGTGLGLAVIYGYMAELGGEILAANRPGGGAEFTLFFPAVAKDTKG